MHGTWDHIRPYPLWVGSNYAGRLTVDLPGTVKPGEVFSVITRQITNAFAGRPSPSPLKPSIALQMGHDRAGRYLVRWRRVLGNVPAQHPGGDQSCTART